MFWTHSTISFIIPFASYFGVRKHNRIIFFEIFTHTLNANNNEEVTLFEDAGLLEEADHITEYRNSGYDVVYIKSGGAGDGTSIDSPKACTDLRAAIKAVESNENKKVVLAVVGGIGCGT